MHLSGNQYLLEAVKAHMHDFNPAWIGTCPGVKVRYCI